MNRPTVRTVLVLAACVLAFVLLPARAAEGITVGSKRFTESYVLAEIVTQTLQRAGWPAEHRPGLGNTAILERALRQGSIDVYPEYTGTVLRELLRRPPGAGTPAPTLEDLNQWLAPLGLRVAAPLGFNNTYALAMREADASRLGVESLSALARLPANEAVRLRPGLSHEFLARADGWMSLERHYALRLGPARALDHGLGLQALAQGRVDLIDVYSTDAQLGRGGFRVLRDDLGHFPRYDAVLLVRDSLPAGALQALMALEGRIDEATMIALNASAESGIRSFAQVARGFLDAAAPDGASAPSDPPSLPALLLAPDLPRLLLEHLALVAGSLLMAVCLGVPLGIAAWRHPRAGTVLLSLTGLIQTIPSLALLAFLISITGTIGFLPALIALFLYALLPIVRNTHTGLAGVPRGLADAARALGLRERQVMGRILLPLAIPSLLAGASTAAVINVGTATVAAFVGAGGLGERIVAGLATGDVDRMLAGAIPAALLALLVQGAFALAGRVLAPGAARAAPPAGRA